MGMLTNTIIAVASASLGYLLYDLGVFTKVMVSKEELPKMTIVGIRFRGPYKDTGKPFNELEKKLIEKKIKTLNYVGLYYDNPKSVPQEKLRTFVGAIIPTPTDEVRKQIKELDLEIVEIERNENAIHAYYPVSRFECLVNLSFMLGPMRVYPAIYNYVVKNMDTCKAFVPIEGKNVPSYEIYDRTANNVHYICQDYTFEVLPDFKLE